MHRSMAKRLQALAICSVLYFLLLLLSGVARAATFCVHTAADALEIFKKFLGAPNMVAACPWDDQQP